MMSSSFSSILVRSGTNSIFTDVMRVVIRVFKDLTPIQKKCYVSHVGMMFGRNAKNILEMICNFFHKVFHSHARADLLPETQKMLQGGGSLSCFGCP